MKLECTPQEFADLVRIFGQRALAPEGLQISSGPIQIHAPAEKMEDAKATLDTDCPVEEVPVEPPAAQETPSKAPEPSSDDILAAVPTDEPPAEKVPEKPAQKATEHGIRIRELILEASTKASIPEALAVLKEAGGVQSAKDLTPDKAPQVIKALEEFISQKGGEA